VRFWGHSPGVKRILEFTGPRGIDLLLALVCGVGLLALQGTPFLQRAEWLAFDKLTQWTATSRPLDPSLAVVAIDDDSLTELGSTQNWAWPWPHGAYADLIAYLKASGAREIWIDLIFYTPDTDGYQDDELRAVAAAAGNVSFGQGTGHDAVSLFQPTFNVSVPVTTEENPVIHSDINGQHLLAWPPPFNVLKKDMARVTPAALLIKDGAKLLKSLSADDRTDPQKIAAMLAQASPPAMADRFRGKIVYIGVTAGSGYDYKAFPVGNHEPSTMIHIVARSNEMQHGFFREIPDWLRDLIVLACCFIVSDLFRRVPQFHRYSICVAAILGLIAFAAYALFLERIWIRPVLDEMAVAMTFVMVTSVNYVREGNKRRMTEDLFGKFVSRKIVDRLVARPEQLKLGGEKAELTVLFSDLSGFTTLSEKMASDVLLGLLNSYLNEMSELIYEREGTLDKYIGDAIMAFWGAPDASPDHAWQACHAALACQKRLAEMAPAWEEQYGAKLTARIGINTDEMTVGLVGSNRLHNYSVIGDAVNLASRLEGANKPFGTAIMIAQRTLDLAQGKIEVRPIAKLQVKGKEKAVMVYELMARAGELDDRQRVMQQLFTEAFTAFLLRDWAKAEGLLLALLSQEPEDELARVYLKRVRDYATHPPERGWDGVFKLDEK
jgi:adenylate cyclase